MNTSAFDQPRLGAAPYGSEFHGETRSSSRDPRTAARKKVLLGSFAALAILATAAAGLGLRSISPTSPSSPTETTTAASLHQVQDADDGVAAKLVTAEQEEYLFPLLVVSILENVDDPQATPADQFQETVKVVQGEAGQGLENALTNWSISLNPDPKAWVLDQWRRPAEKRTYLLVAQKKSDPDGQKLTVLIDLSGKKHRGRLSSEQVTAIADWYPKAIMVQGAFARAMATVPEVAEGR